MKRLVMLLVAAAALAAAQDWVNLWGSELEDLEGFDIATTSGGGVFALGMGGTDTFPSNRYLAVVRYDSDGTRTHVASFYNPAVFGTEFHLAAVDDHLLVGIAEKRGFLTVVAASDEGDSLWLDEHILPDEVWYDFASVVPDGSGGFYAVGPAYTESTWTDIATYRYQRSGAVVWSRTYNGPYGRGNDMAYATAADSAGSLYIAGLVRNRLQKKKPGVVKYRDDGTFEWLHMYGPEAMNSGDYRDVAYSPAGYIYAAGAQGDSGTCPVVKLRTNGDTVWTRAAVGYVTDLAVDAHDNLYLAGHNVQYHMVHKYSPTGVLLWTWQPAEEPLGTDLLLDIVVDGNDCPVVCGYKHIETGVRRAFVAKLTPDGDTSWTTMLWPDSSGQVRAIAVDNQSSIYVTGVMSQGNDGWGTAKYRTGGPGVTELPAPAQPARASLEAWPSVAARGCRLQVPDGGGCGGLWVVDVAGRSVRSFGPVAGGGNISWDLRDDAGAAVANGVYLVVADGPDSPAPARVIVQR